MTMLWPRLDQLHAELEFTAIAHAQGAPGVRQLSSADLVGLTYASSGGTRAELAQLRALRDVIFDCATRYGFPDSALADPVAFDRALAPGLRDAMPMSMGEALNREVWNTVALRVAPDATLWRFGLGNRERWVCIDRTRHIFSRLWWQVEALGVPTPEGRDTSLLDLLTESDLNQLLERTSIGGCRPLVRSLAQAITEMADSVPRREVVRDLGLRTLRLLAVIDPYSVDDEELQRLARELVRESLDALQ